MRTSSEEDYLKAIYHLSEEKNEKVATNSLAKSLNMKASSVTDMLKKLSDKNWVNYQKYQGVCLTKKGTDIAVLSIGTIGNTVTKAIENIDAVAHYDMRFAKPLDEGLLHIVFNKFNKIITVEDGIIKGGFGSAILEFANEHHYTNKNIECFGIPDEFVEHGSVEELHKSVGLDILSIKKFINSQA